MNNDLIQTYTSAFEWQTLSPLACILVYMAVFIAVAFLMYSLDFSKVLRKEFQTPTIGIILFIVVTLVVTFAIGSLIIVMGSAIATMAN